MFSKASTRAILCVVLCLAFAREAAAQPAWAKPEWLKPVPDRLAAVPNLGVRLAALEKALGAAQDQTSLSATTARYTLEIFKDVEANPKTYGPSPLHKGAQEVRLPRVIRPRRPHPKTWPITCLR